MKKKTQYVLMFVIDGITKQLEYPVGEKAQAISDFKNIRMRADRAKLFAIDREFNDLWYDIGKNY